MFNIGDVVRYTRGSVGTVIDAYDGVDGRIHKVRFLEFAGFYGWIADVHEGNLVASEFTDEEIARWAIHVMKK